MFKDVGLPDLRKCGPQHVAVIHFGCSATSLVVVTTTHSYVLRRRRSRQEISKYFARGTSSNLLSQNSANWG